MSELKTHVFGIIGTYIPSCDEDGYYRKLQCDQSKGECWCVDQHGEELMGTRIHGNTDCGKHTRRAGTQTHIQRAQGRLCREGLDTQNHQSPL